MKYNIDIPFILYVGNVESRKNVSLLIKSFYKLKKQGIKHKLVLIGTRKFGFNQILELVIKLNLLDEVIFTGYIPDEDLVKFYNAADLFVFPSLYEGFGLPPLEAMACGCPVIVSNTFFITRSSGEAGILVDPYDSDALAEEMYKILINNDLKEELSKKSVARAKMFSWKKASKRNMESI